MGVGDKEDMSFEMDLSKAGYEMFFKPYQVQAIQYLWTVEGSAKSVDVWNHVKVLGDGISRASIINSLNDMVDHGILDHVERTGKGGHHRVYSHKYTETQLKEYLASSIIMKLFKEFPVETRKAVKNAQ